MTWSVSADNRTAVTLQGVKCRLIMRMAASFILREFMIPNSARRSMACHHMVIAGSTADWARLDDVTCRDTHAGQHGGTVKG